MATRGRKPKKEETKVEKQSGYCMMQYSEKCKKQEGHRRDGLFFTLKEEQGNVDFFKGIRIINIHGNDKNYIPICKDCVKEYCYNDKGEVILERFKALLMLANLPFLEEKFNDCVKADVDTIGTYFTRIGLNHKDLKWLDGDCLKGSTMTINDEEIEMTYDMKQLRKKWGRGYSEDDLEILEDMYNEVIVHCDNAESYGTQETAKLYCRSQLDVEQKRLKDAKTKDSEEAVYKYMTKLGISPDKVSEKKNSHNFIREIADIEEKKPADLFWTKLYKDVDQLGIYFKKFFLRPTKNLLTGSRDFDEEYRIDDEDGFLEIEEYDDGINLIDAEELEELEEGGRNEAKK